MRRYLGGMFAAIAIALILFCLWAAPPPDGGPIEKAAAPPQGRCVICGELTGEYEYERGWCCWEHRMATTPE